MDGTNTTFSYTTPQVLSTWCVNDSTPNSLEAIVTTSEGESYSDVNLTLNELCGPFANRTAEDYEEGISPRKSFTLPQI